MAHLPPLTGRSARKLVLSLGVFVVSLAAAELAARGWARIHGRPYSVWRTAVAMDEIVSNMVDLLPEGRPSDEPEGTGGPRGIPYSLHPYSGFVVSTGLHVEERMVRYFREQRGEDDLVVIIQGGSVAARFTGMEGGSRELLEARLGAHTGRKVRMFRCCHPGFKQPQQLTQMAYYLTRGCTPDVVVNIDGLNEVRAGPSNALRGIQPTWPSLGHWAQATEGDRFDPEALDRVLELRDLQRRAVSLVRGTRARGLHYSCLLGRSALSRLRGLRARWANAQRALVEHMREVGGESSKSFGLPPEPVWALAESVQAWFESSVALRDLCASRGILYLHVLQPTLHDEGSKPITPEEHEKGIGERGPNPNVVAGYPMMRAKVPDLIERGVHVLDATRIFADVEETLYFDNCHFLERGNEILADHVLAALTALLPQGH